MDLSQQILSEVTVHMKYARYLPTEQRRETWKAGKHGQRRKTKRDRNKRKQNERYGDGAEPSGGFAAAIREKEYLSKC